MPNLHQELLRIPRGHGMYGEQERRTGEKLKHRTDVELRRGATDGQEADRWTNAKGPKSGRERKEKNEKSGEIIPSERDRNQERERRRRRARNRRSQRSDKRSEERRQHLGAMSPTT